MKINDFLRIALEQNAKDLPEQAALQGSSGREISCAELPRLLQTISRDLYQHGVRPGATLGIQMPQSLTKALAIISTLSMEACGSLIERDCPKLETLRWKEELRPRCLLATERQFRIFWGDQPVYNVQEVHSLSNFSQERILLAQFYEDRMFKQDETAWLLATSGSTGHRKHVMLDSHDLVRRIQSEVELLKSKPRQRILNVLQFTHDLGFHQLLSSVTSGACLMIRPFSSPFSLIQLLENEKFDGITATPQVWIQLLKEIDKSPVNRRLNLSYLTVSGGALPKPLLDKLQELFPTARIVRTYGQTETFRSLFDGKPLPGVQLRLVDEAGHEINDGSVGQLLHFGIGVMSGYFGDLRLSEQKFVFDPRFGKGVATGDYFFRTSGGEYIFKGRRDDMIKRKDYRIYLSEIENCLLSCPAVGNAAVFSSSEDGLDSALTAVLVLKPSGERNQVERFIEENLSFYMRPDKLIYTDSLPVGSAGKIDRRRLKEQWNY